MNRKIIALLFDGIIIGLAYLLMISAIPVDFKLPIFLGAIALVFVITVEAFISMTDEQIRAGFF